MTNPNFNGTALTNRQNWSDGTASGGDGFTPPTLQFTFNPDQPVAEAAWDTGSAYVHVALTLAGTVTVAFPNASQNISYDLTTGGWTAAGSAAVGQFTSGLYVTGLDTKEPAVGCSFGSQFAQTSLDFTPPDTLSVGGTAQVGTSIETDHGPVDLTGTAGYTLAVTITPHAAPEYATVVDWDMLLEAAMIVGGAVLLVAVVVSQPETAFVLVPAMATQMNE